MTITCLCLLGLSADLRWPVCDASIRLDWSKYPHTHSCVCACVYACVCFPCMHVGKPENNLELCSLGVACLFWGGSVWRMVRQGPSCAGLELTGSQEARVLSVPTALALGLQAYSTALPFLTRILGVELRFSACLAVLCHLSSPGSAMQASIPGANPWRLLLIGIRLLEPTLSQTLRFGGEKHAILF